MVDGLHKRAANYDPLTPIHSLARSAAVYPEQPSVVYGERRYTWRETHQRCCRLASALLAHGLQPGDTVSVMAANTPELYEAHFAVPMAGGVLNALNTRLDASTLAYILEHAQTRLLITDSAFSEVIRAALLLLDEPPLVIDILDPVALGQTLGHVDYEAFLQLGDETFEGFLPADEWQAISLNYTSGTTGKPKGVVYSHRGAQLLAMGNVMAWDLPHHPRYLWTLPMFHCNGWCFPWTLALVAGTSVCLRQVEGQAMVNAIAKQQVTHLCGAPIVLDMLGNADLTPLKGLGDTIKIMTAAAPPPATTLAKMAEAGFEVTHVYGLTEVYGPAVVCAQQPEWRDYDADKKAELTARQGVNYAVQSGLCVADPETLEIVPSDGERLGEVMMRGNATMMGYFKQPEATEKAFAGGWFHTGDLAVRHPDGYIELKDRSKDIIISGGENISSIEVEGALYRHPAVSAVAVVAQPDPKWGESPCAFVSLKPDVEATEKELIDHCRSEIAHYKCPKRIVFGELPVTSTGKIQKFPLREKARQLPAD